MSLMVNPFSPAPLGLPAPVDEHAARLRLSTYKPQHLVIRQPKLKAFSTIYLTRENKISYLSLQTVMTIIVSLSFLSACKQPFLLNVDVRYEILLTFLRATDLVHIGNYQTKIQLSVASCYSSEQQLARIWESLYTCFPGIRSHTNLSADTINDYSNLMTLEASLHMVFGKFEIALDPTILPQPNENNEHIIKFEKHADYELPNRVLLGTHAAVAKILHATGMAETIEKNLA
ncbi:hypothetical protein I7I51_02127 [Histoplasma capsulatum]|uniref:HNH nuclease domain-containing protein n=1 Tax=Ajellomyces capsulatus TaxID=5037 RepID=A0A8A1MAY0_AJECA|nr:hypothetical protein I7I51_02127 [Histoplasma capsulatum]